MPTSPPARPRVAAVVVDYGHEATVGTTLRSLRAGRVAPVQTVLVEHHPAGRALPVTAEADPAATIVVPATNTGFAGGCNAGAAAARPDVDWLLFLNPDAAVEPACV